VVLQGMKTLYFVKKSTITKMASKPLETSKGAMWSTEIRSNGIGLGVRDEEHLGVIVALF